MDYLEWRTVLGETVTQLIQRIAGYLPNLLGALALLLLGWLLARLSRTASARVTVIGLNGLARSRTMERALERTGLRQRIPRLVSGIAYWVVLLFFLATAIERLALPVATALVSGLAYYLPKVLLGVLIVFAGILAGNVAYGTIAAAATTAGVSYALVLGRAVQIFLIFLGVGIGADQIGIQSTFLTVIVTIVVGTALGGAALAFGLGSGLTASNIISSYYLLKTYRVGQTVRIGGVQGRIVEITQTAVILEAPEGRILVPARKFSEEASVLLPGDN